MLIFPEKLGVIIMAKNSFYLLVNQTAGEKACKKTAGKRTLFDFVGRHERCSISGSVESHG